MRLAVVPAVLLATAACSAEPEDFSSRVDAIFADFDQPDVPGCAVGVIHAGDYVHAKGYGMANLEHGIPIGTGSVFRIGSVSKQFTAMAIAILAVRGDLDLDVDVHAYLPELHDYGVPVTIRQMVHHVSGMGEYEGKFTYEIRDGVPFRFGNEDYWTIGEFYEAVAKQPLALPPGERYEYSNIAYFLLSQVVERVSGKTLREFADEEMFGPLGMEQTFFNDNVNAIVPNRADGYRPLEDGGWEIFMTNLSWVGDGGIYTNLDDFIHWNRAFVTANIPGGDEVEALMLEPHPLTMETMDPGSLDEGTGYGFGLDVGTYEGRRVHAHSGSWVGFVAFYARFPDDDTSVVFFCNRPDGLAEERVKRTMDLALAVFGQ